jgi:hypothetical protein
MAIAVTIPAQNIDATGVLVWALGTLAFSGSYTTGGDTLDLSQQPLVPSTQVPIQATIQGQSGYNYVFIPGSALNTNKVKIYSSGQTELASGAYPAAITSDSVAIQAAFKRLQ